MGKFNFRTARFQSDMLSFLKAYFDITSTQMMHHLKPCTLVFLLREQVVISEQGGFFMKFVEMSRLY